MSKWRKSSPALVERFAALVPDDRRVERRQMFGYPAAFLGGHLFMSLFEESLLLRLGERDRAELLGMRGARTFEPMPGRPMREYVLVPPDVVADDEAMGEWVERAVGFVGAMPAKATKKKSTGERTKRTANRQPGTGSRERKSKKKR